MKVWKLQYQVCLRVETAQEDYYKYQKLYMKVLKQV